MCGIAGYINLQLGWVEPEFITTMTSLLRHRGPDSEGFYVDDCVVLGHRRLRVIDTFTGDQPIYNEDGSVVVVFNGEIYNFLRLRQDLEQRGHRFSTQSDTETIVHAYEEFGVDCVEQLEGMFAFALWDRRHKRLLLAIDRLGIKPLLYFQDDEYLVFASELQAVRSVPYTDTVIDDRAVWNYFSLGYIPGPLSVYRKIEKLLPAHVLVVENGTVRTDRYWCLKPGMLDTIRSDEAADLLREKLDESVTRCLAADVPLGAFLSGGVDSSIVVGLMARAMKERVKTFSLGFEEQPLLDETAYANTVAKYHGTEHHALRLRYSDVQEAVPDALNGMGEPFADYSFLPTYALCKETRRSVTVVLSGDGGDELFAGYTKYLGELYHRYYVALPVSFRDSLLSPVIRALPVGRTSSLLEVARKAQRFLDGVSEDPVLRHIGWMRIVQPEVLKTMLSCQDHSSLLNQRIRSLYEMGGRCWHDDQINRMLFADLMFELPFAILPKVDMASMQHGLEVRVPLLDHRFVEFAFSLPGHLKLRGIRKKFVLKEAFGDLLPPSIRRRRKQGFDLPVGEWLKKEMKDLFHDVTFGLDNTAAWLNLKVIRELYKQHCDGRRDHTKLLWSILVFQWWNRRCQQQAFL